jgi:hypothetical protein
MQRAAVLMPRPLMAFLKPHAENIVGMVLFQQDLW